MDANIRFFAFNGAVGVLATDPGSTVEQLLLVAAAGNAISELMSDIEPQQRRKMLEYLIDDGALAEGAET